MGLQMMSECGTVGWWDFGTVVGQWWDSSHSTMSSTHQESGVSTRVQYLKLQSVH